jgi:hypothetical protein
MDCIPVPEAPGFSRASRPTWPPCLPQVLLMAASG